MGWAVHRIDLGIGYSDVFGFDFFPGQMITTEVFHRPLAGESRLMTPIDRALRQGEVAGQTKVAELCRSTVFIAVGSLACSEVITW